MLCGVIWSNTVCLDIPGCGTPQTPLNSVVEVEGMTATYTCQEGYRMVGSREVECTEAGWARQIPHCKGIIMKILKQYLNLLALVSLYFTHDMFTE